MGGKRVRPEVQDSEILAQVEEILRFSGLQGARTVIEKLDDGDDGRRRLRVRAVRGEGKRDFFYEVLIQENGLMGIYPTA